MSNIRTLIAQAETDAIAVEKVKAELEAARRRVDELRTELDGAKASLDGTYALIEEAGMPKSKAKKVVEGIIGLLAEAGIAGDIEDARTPAPAAEAAPKQPVVRRSRRRGSEAGDVEAATAGADATATESPVGETAPVGQGEETVEIAPLTSEAAPATVAADGVAGTVDSEEARAEDGTTADEGENSDDAMEGDAQGDTVEEEIENPVIGGESADRDEASAEEAVADAESSEEGKAPVEPEHVDLFNGADDEADEQGGEQPADGGAEAAPVGELPAATQPEAAETPTGSVEASPAAPAASDAPKGYRRPSFLRRP